MEIGPIFRALINHRTRFWLIVVEIALTLAIVANCVHMIQDRRAKIHRPTGMDEENILIAESEPFAPEFQDEEFVETSYDEDLRALRALPGVLAVSAMHQVPLSGSGSATGRRAVGNEEETRSVAYFAVGPDVVDALGIEILAGRDLIESDYPSIEEVLDEADDDGETTHANVLLTKAAADIFFPDGDAVGKDIENKQGSSVETVVGVVELMHGSWPLSSIVERVMLYPSRPANSRRVRYIVRVEPGMEDGRVRPSVGVPGSPRPHKQILQDMKVLEIEWAIGGRAWWRYW